jgi:hypothetical protein
MLPVGASAFAVAVALHFPNDATFHLVDEAKTMLFFKYFE